MRLDGKQAGIVAFAAAALIIAGVGPCLAQDAGTAADCSTYATNRANAENPAGAGAVGGAARGAARGAIFGGIIDGSDGAKKGAAVAGGIGLLRGAANSNQNKQQGYNYYYNECMQGRT
jgi:hypothetical protein